MMRISLILLFFYALTFARCSSVPLESYTLSSSFTVGVWDSTGSVKIPLMKGVVTVQVLHSERVGIDSITVTFNNISYPSPSLFNPTRRVIRVRTARRPAADIASDPKYHFPPPPPTSITTPSHHLNFSILNDARVAWSRRKRRRRPQIPPPVSG
ncbi:hypothetical protein C8Q70DRAFT_932056 [Cubamyces menziesii]|uniref:Uncharacterized protein n=1 Tax=Trametes cubensis TaxID=1111947 RepID=A0AAD7TVZ8_9APHY|nr:hypothetical protein C8Q70DRAFT_932056 [Cubamyces menziesii]KAJ8486778.1 hypothetical protein ONZ51_g4619 [Trametes cubensis]